jgi:hypothetical protein
MRKMIVVVLMMALTLLGCDTTGLHQRQQHTWGAVFGLYAISESLHIKKFICTATAVERIPGGYHLLTAGHCVNPEDAPDDAVYSVDEEIHETPLLQVVTVVQHVEDSVRHLDYGILELKSAKWYPIETIDVNAKIPRLEEKVYLVHFAKGLGKQISLGRVSSKPLNRGALNGQCRDNDDVCADNFIVQAFAARGASGALLISLQTGKPVGILVGGFDSGFTVEPIAKIAADLKRPVAPVPLPAGNVFPARP